MNKFKALHALRVVFLALAAFTIAALPVVKLVTFAFTGDAAGPDFVAADNPSCSPYWQTMSVTESVWRLLALAGVFALVSLVAFLVEEWLAERAKTDDVTPG